MPERPDPAGIAAGGLRRRRALLAALIAGMAGDPDVLPAAFEFALGEPAFDALAPAVREVWAEGFRCALEVMDLVRRGDGVCGPDARAGEINKDA